MLTSSLNLDATRDKSGSHRQDPNLGAPSPGYRPDAALPFRSHLSLLGAACAGPFLVGASATALLASQGMLKPQTILLPTVLAAALATIGFSSVTRRLILACGALGETTAAVAAGRRALHRVTAVREVNTIIDMMAWGMSRQLACPSATPEHSRGNGQTIDIDNEKAQELVALARANPDLVIVTNGAGQILEANAQVEAVFGWPKTDVVGMALEALLPDFFGGVGELAWDPESVFDMPPGAAMKFDGITREERAVALEGYWARWSSGDGQQRISLVLRDVTAERQRYERLRRSKDTTRRENADKTRFLLAMSDEVREPLNAVVGLADLLLEHEGLEDESRLRIGMMRSAGASLLDVVSDAIDLSRLDTGTLKLEAKPFSVRTVLQECVAAARSLALPRDLTLTCAVDPSVPAFVLGDAARFRQVVSNMIVNVMRLRRRGEAHVSLVALEDPEHWLRLVVTESGPGLAEGTLDDMLRDLGPLDDIVARRLGGARMSMTIARRLTDLMDGRIGVSSRGSTSSSYYFEARYPACAPAAVSATPRPTPEISQPLRVLVVDDVASNREVAVAVMQSAKHDVDSVVGAEEAIEAVRGVRYDVILMDVEMPDFDGLMATRAIRSLTGPAGCTPVIALTAGVYPEQIAACRAAGMDDHIGKPVNFEELKDKVVRWAARGSARVEHFDRSVVGVAIGWPDFRYSSNSVGQARAVRLLEAFADRLVEPLSDLDDVAVVRTEAHGLVAESGMLGFRELSRACQALEVACDKNSPDRLAEFVQRVIAEAEAARLTIARLRR